MKAFTLRKRTDCMLRLSFPRVKRRLSQMSLTFEDLAWIQGKQAPMHLRKPQIRSATYSLDRSLRNRDEKAGFMKMSKTLCARNMYKALAVLLILLLCPTAYSIGFQVGLDQRVTELSQQIEKEMDGTHKKTIAVVEFTDLGGCVTDFGRYPGGGIDNAALSNEEVPRDRKTTAQQNNRGTKTWPYRGH